MQYYATLGASAKDEKTVYDSLIQAVKNSRKKGYHGDDDKDDGKSTVAVNPNLMDIQGEQS